MPHSSLTKALAVLAAGAFFWLLLSHSAPQPRIHILRGATMGTTWQAQIVADDAKAVRQVNLAIDTLLHRLDREVFSTWSEHSELSELNRSPPHTPHAISAEMLDVLQLAQHIYERSRHTFDVSIGELVNLWGFGPRMTDAVPEEDAIEQARLSSGLAAMKLDAAASTVTFDRPLALDLSGIAKGYAVDEAAGLLQKAGFVSFLIEIGGELRVRGMRPDGSNWRVAVERPAGGPPQAYARIDTQGEAIAIAGSGDYRNFREAGGKRYSHEIDPRTGFPVSHTLASVTVISHTAAEADAWATALMVLGPDEGRAVADSEELAAYFIMRAPAGLEHAYTAAFARYLQPVVTNAAIHR